MAYHYISNILNNYVLKTIDKNRKIIFLWAITTIVV